MAGISAEYVLGLGFEHHHEEPPCAKLLGHTTLKLELQTKGEGTGLSLSFKYAAESFLNGPPRTS